MHDPNPRIIVVKGLGIFSVGNNFKDSNKNSHIFRKNFDKIIKVYSYEPYFQTF